MQSKIPQHPGHDFQCQNCKFWHPNTIAKMIYLPNQPPIPISDFHAQGRVKPANAITARSSFCFHHPQWVMTNEDSYCSYFDPWPWSKPD